MLPTPGIIAFTNGDRDQKRMSAYSRGYGERELAKYRGGREVSPSHATAPIIVMPNNDRRLALVAPQPTESVVAVDLSLRKAIPIPVTIRNPDGKPATEAIEIYGGNEDWWHTEEPQGFVVKDLLPDQRRKVFAFDRSRNLIGGTIVEHGEVTQPTISLSAAGRLHERLVDDNGEPITDVVMTAEYSDTDNESATWAWTKGKITQPQEIVPDDNGRFEILGDITIESSNN